MPRWLGFSSTSTPDIAGDVGRTIFQFFDLPLDSTTSFYSEPNGKGLFLSLKSEAVEKRAIVCDANGSTKEKLDPAEEMKLLLDSLPATERSKVLESIGLMDRQSAPADPNSPITSVFDLDSIFTDPEPIEYLIEPEIPAESVVYLAGAPESGKSTLACAWGRDLAAQGHGVLLLDKDRNPRSVIRERFQRLGITVDHSLFRVWDSRQKSDPPRPDSPVVLDWVRRMRLKTGKPPLVIVDSAVAFLLPHEDENSSKDVRALFNRCRAVVDAGGNVVLLHHPGKTVELRGSSDFGAAADQGFIVTNSPTGAHELSRITLKVHKTRYALSKDLVYDYRDGKMVRCELVTGETVPGAPSGKPDDTTIRKLTELLRANPGLGSREFEALAHKSAVAYNKARRFLAEGVKSGKIRTKTLGRKKQHFLSDGSDE